MKGSAVGIIAVVALAVGFGAGFGLRPVLVPVTSAAAVTGLAQPTEQEATDSGTQLLVHGGPEAETARLTTPRISTWPSYITTLARPR